VSKSENILLGKANFFLSPEMIYSAFLSVEYAESIEAKPRPISRRSVFIHKSAVITAITSSVCFLESTINEFYYLVSDKERKAVELDEDARNKLSSIWSVDRFRNNARTLEKYQTVLQLLNIPIISEGDKVFQNAKIVIDLRNAFIHYNPETRIIKLFEEKDSLINLEKSLKGKFKLNPFMEKYPVIHTKYPKKRADYPIFPEQCFSKDCAKWAANSVFNFSNEFFRRLKFRPYYESFVGILPGTVGGNEEKEKEKEKELRL